MNPTPTAIAAIRARVSDWTPGDAELADVLNQATEPNPVPQGTVPREMSVARMMTECNIPVAEMQALIGSTLLMAIRGDVAAQDHDGVLTLAQCALIAGHISQATHDTVAAWVQGTDPDPDYRATLSWAEITLGRLVDTDDIAAARAAGS